MPHIRLVHHSPCWILMEVSIGTLLISSKFYTVTEISKILFLDGPFCDCVDQQFSRLKIFLSPSICWNCVGMRNQDQSSGDVWWRWCCRVVWCRWCLFCLAEGQIIRIKTLNKIRHGLRVSKSIKKVYFSDTKWNECTLQKILDINKYSADSILCCNFHWQ